MGDEIAARSPDPDGWMVRVMMGRRLVVCLPLALLVWQTSCATRGYNHGDIGLMYIGLFFSLSMWWSSNKMRCAVDASSEQCSFVFKKWERICFHMYLPCACSVLYIYLVSVMTWFFTILFQYCKSASSIICVGGMNLSFKCYIHVPAVNM